MCHEIDVASCLGQKGCFVSLDGESCTGAATSCSMLNTDAACEDQLGCTWESSSEPPPPR